MSTYFLDKWKSPLKDICSFMNDNLENNMLSIFRNQLDEIVGVMSDEVSKMFTSKNSFLWFATYNKFTKLNLEPNRFIEFMEEFNKNLTDKEWNGETFTELNKVSTKKKTLIIKKLQLLEEFMNEFLHINKEDLEKVNTLDFIKENVKADATEEDVEFYSDMLDDLTLEVDNDTKLLDEHNRPSLLALIGYACENDIDLDDWIKQWFMANTVYVLNQKRNFEIMRDSIKKGAVV